MKRGLGPIGFIIAAEVVALFAYAAVPVLREEAAIPRRAAQDVQLVLAAAASAREQLGSWPEDVAPGSVPPSLTSLLPAGFTFDRGKYVLDWDHWRLRNGTDPSSPEVEFLGVSVTTTDSRLASRIRRRLGSKSMQFTVGNRTTIAISDPQLPTP